MDITVTKRVTFSSGHRIYNPELSDEKNREIFGPCSNPGGHGHNYVMEVSVTGPIEKETGMVINLKRMKAIIEKEIVEKLDHKNLNTDVDFMAGIIPTTENLIRRIWEILEKKIGHEYLSKIVVWESENNKFEINRK